eukprot:202272-Hanusia_phi.AAC.3
MKQGVLYDNCTSAYAKFYPVCYDTTPIEDIVPKELRTDWTKVPWTVKADEYDNVVPDQMAPPTSPHDVNATRNDPTKPNFWQAFTYRVPNGTAPPNSIGYWSPYSSKIEPQYASGGFQVFLSLADGPARNQEKVQFLIDNRWLDRFTRKIEIKFAVYNGMLHRFTFVKINFGFSTTGTYKPFNTKGGTIVKIESIDMEPYRIPQVGGCVSNEEERLKCLNSTTLSDQFKCGICTPGVSSDEIRMVKVSLFPEREV